MNVIGVSDWSLGAQNVVKMIMIEIGLTGNDR